MPLCGYIKLYRSLLDWQWHDDPNTLSVWIHLLLKANFKPTVWHGINLKPGQIITSRASLAKETGLSERQIRTSLTRLKTTECLTIETTSKYTLISIINFGFFQDISATGDQQTDQLTDHENDQPSTSERPQRNNDKNARIKEGSVCKRKSFIPPTVDEAINFFSEKGEPSSEAQRFCDYYASIGWRVGKNPMKNWRAAASGWISRNRREVPHQSQPISRGLRAVPTAEDYRDGVDSSGFGWA